MAAFTAALCFLDLSCADQKCALWLCIRLIQGTVPWLERVRCGLQGRVPRIAEGRAVNMTQCHDPVHDGVEHGCENDGALACIANLHERGHPYHGCLQQS